MAPERWTIGDVTITKVEELSGWGPLEERSQAVPDATREEIEAIAWLNPSYVRDGTLSMSVHSFLIETPDRKVVVDTGIGNPKQRPMWMFNSLETDFLERFGEVWAPDEVDGVICTHLHVDHAGWNTRLEGGSWIPTFPRASYYFAWEEYAHWQAYARNPALGAAYTAWAHDMVDGQAVFGNSVRPVAEAGAGPAGHSRAVSITLEISLLATPGRTPGQRNRSSSSRVAKAVITGDIMHTPPSRSPAPSGPRAWTPIRCGPPAPGVSSSTEPARNPDSRPRNSFLGTPTGGLVVRDGSSLQAGPPALNRPHQCETLKGRLADETGTDGGVLGCAGCVPD